MLSEEDLESVIAALIARKDAAVEDSAEWRFCHRQLAGLRYSYEMAGGIIEDLDPFGWAPNCHPH